MDISAATVDDETARLVLQLQLDDFHELSERSKGKQREHEPTDDFWVAINLYHAELESAKGTVADRKMSRSIAVAVLDDGALISEWAEQEAQAAEDRKLALRFGTGTTTPPGEHRHDGPPAVDAELLDELAALYVVVPDGGGVPAPEPEQAESSSWAAGRRPGTGTAGRGQHARCAICLDDFPPDELSRAPCAEHQYCRGCLADLFARSLADESLFPPRCCGRPIPVEANRAFLEAAGAPGLVAAFLARAVEMATPDRTYCHRPGCSAFVPPQLVRGGVGACPRCAARTCAFCKGAEHPARRDCPEDPGLREVLRVAAENEWQRCYACHSVVELHAGCHHITCRCGAQFCYVCGARWRSCECPQWLEERLLDRAVAVVDRDAGPRGVAPARRAELVEAAREELRANHQCRHGAWGRIWGRRRCEECHDVLAEYLNVCQRCRIMVCQRCRLNRV